MPWACATAPSAVVPAASPVVAGSLPGLGRERVPSLAPPAKAVGRIVIATDAWEPQVNGVVRTLRRTCEALKAAGRSVSIIHPGLFQNYGAPFYPEVRLAYPICRRRLRELIHKAQGDEPSEVDHIHIATEGPVGWAVRSHCLRNGLQFTTAYHTHFPEYMQAMVGLPPWVCYAYLRQFHLPSSRVLVATPSMQAHLKTHGFRNPTTVWSRGVEDRFFTPAFERLPRSRPRLLYVGRVSVEKNIEEFLAAHVDAEKHVVGDGPDRGRLSRAYPEAIFHGYLHGAELVEAYAQADAFVFPSRTDTFGLVVLEALAAGLPVAAHPVQGPADTLAGHADCGCLDEDLTTAIRGALAQGNRAACRRLAAQYSWERSTVQFLAALVPARPLPAGAHRASIRTLKRPAAAAYADGATY